MNESDDATDTATAATSAHAPVPAVVGVHADLVEADDPATPDEPTTVGALGNRVLGKVGEMTDVAAADRVYAPPVEAHGHIVIPAAVVKWSGGFGFGATRSENPDLQGGGGGGGGGEGRPIAIIDVSADGVRIKPVWDFTKLGLTVVTAVLTIWRASRKH